MQTLRRLGTFTPRQCTHTQVGDSDIHGYPYPVFDVEHYLCTVIVKLYVSVQLEMTLYSHHFSGNLAVSNYMSQLQCSIVNN